MGPHVPEDPYSVADLPSPASGALSATPHSRHFATAAHPTPTGMTELLPSSPAMSDVTASRRCFSSKKQILSAGLRSSTHCDLLPSVRSADALVPLAGFITHPVPQSPAILRDSRHANRKTDAEEAVGSLHVKPPRALGCTAPSASPRSRYC